MTKQQLIKIHEKLHKSLDKLLACYFQNTKIENLNDKTSILELINWSFEQTKNPICYKPKKTK